MLGKTEDLQTLGENLKKTFPNCLKVLQNDSDNTIVDPGQADFNPQNDINDIPNLVYNNCDSGLAVGLIYHITSKLDFNLTSKLIQDLIQTMKIMETKRQEEKNKKQGLGKQTTTPDTTTELKKAMEFLQLLSVDLLSAQKPKYSFAAFSRSIFPNSPQNQLQQIYEIVKTYNLDIAIASLLFYYELPQSLETSSIKTSYEKSKINTTLSLIEKEKFKLLTNLTVQCLGDDEVIEPQPNTLYFYKDYDNNACPFLLLIQNTEEQIEKDFKQAHQNLLRNILFALNTVSDNSFDHYLIPLKNACKYKSIEDFFGYLLQFDDQFGGGKILNSILQKKAFQTFFQNHLFHLNAPNLPKQADGQTVSLYADSTMKNQGREQEAEDELEIDSDVDENEEFSPEQDLLRQQRRKERKQRNEEKIERIQAKQRQEKALIAQRENLLRNLQKDLENVKDPGALRISKLVRMSQMQRQVSQLQKY